MGGAVFANLGARGPRRPSTRRLALGGRLAPGSEAHRLWRGCLPVQEGEAAARPFGPSLRD